MQILISNDQILTVPCYLNDQSISEFHKNFYINKTILSINLIKKNNFTIYLISKK